MAVIFAAILHFHMMQSPTSQIYSFNGFLAPQNIRLDTKIIILGQILPELSETAAILDAILNFSKRSTLQGVHPADSERVHPRLPKLINKNTLHKISGFFILLPDYLVCSRIDVTVPSIEIWREFEV